MDQNDILSWLQNLIGNKQQMQGSQFNQGIGLQSQQVSNQNQQAQAQLAAQIQAQQAAQKLSQQQQDQGNALSVGQQGLQKQNQEDQFNLANWSRTPDIMSFLSNYTPAFDKWSVKPSFGITPATSNNYSAAVTRNRQ